MRDPYDVANALWRKQVFQDVATIDGVPTPMRVCIDNVESGDWSELNVGELRDNVRVSDDIFDLAKLREVARNPIWSASGK